MNPELILHHVKELVTVDPDRMTPESPLGILRHGAMAVEHGKIVWIGDSDQIHLSDYPDAMWINASDQCVFPGLIDSHTHVIFAGNRADEFEKRLQGVSYLALAEAGGGILKTVRETRLADEEKLYALTKARLENMMGFGVTTVEAKCSYGLSLGTELKCLHVLRQLQHDMPLSILPTVMPAHEIPPEYKGKPQQYVDVICQEILPALAEPGIAEFCDVFCEKGVFDTDESRQVLEAGKLYGLKPRIHAEEFADTGGALLAAEVGALSADHLLCISDEGIQALKTGGVVATLLPGTAFYLRLKDYAPARRLIDAGVTVALASDFNPGSCMIGNIQLILHLACLQMGMSPAEAIRGVTLNAAKALGLEEDRGSLTVGKRADFLITDIGSHGEWLYQVGVNPVRQVFVGGHLVAENQTRRML